MTPALPPARQPRILIVDFSQPFRDAARELLEARGFAVVGEAASAAGALLAAARLRPDGILIDVRLPDSSGFDVSAKLARAVPRAAILLTCASDLPECDALAQASGARAFVLKRDLSGFDLAEFWSLS